MTKARWVRFVAGLFVLSLVVAACSSDDEAGGTTGTTGGATGATQTGSGGGGTTVTISGFAFHPDTITVSGPTEVTITNEDSTTHTFTLDDGSVDETVEPGATETVTVDVSASTGFHCNIHPQMTGQIEVS
ncbi:MAG TPA: cupredoxin domain-containing protein [Actinomycetota bacterium]|jgi:plastocyanin